MTSIEERTASLEAKVAGLDRIERRLDDVLLQTAGISVRLDEFRSGVVAFALQVETLAGRMSAHENQVEVRLDGIEAEQNTTKGWRRGVGVSVVVSVMALALALFFGLSQSHPSSIGPTPEVSHGAVSPSGAPLFAGRYPK